MNITLKSEQAELIQQQINSGKYNSPEEVVSEALTLLLQQDDDDNRWIQETREKVDTAIAKLRKGQGIDGDRVISQLEETLRQARNRER